MITKNKTYHHFSGRGSFAQSLYNESGIALISALLLMVVMIALVPVAIHLTTAEIGRTQDFKENREAFFVAEAGLEHAKYLTEQSTLRATLAGPDDIISTTPSDPENDDNGTFGLATPVSLPVDDGNLYDVMVFNGNTYYIRASDNEDGDGNPAQDRDNMIILSAVSIVDDTTTAVQALIYNPPGVPISAVVTNGNLTISGNPGIAGDCGSVHANGNLDLSGDPNINVNATASGTYTAGGSPTVGGIFGGSLPNVNIPLLDPTEYEQYADFVLAADGNVYDANGDIISGGLPEWSYSTPKWDLSGNSATDGFYYIEGDATISGNPGSPGTPWQVTIVATGHIEISGNPRFVNLKNPLDPIDIQNIFMLAGTDVKWNGNPTQNVEGFIYATEQIDLSGNPSINGAILAYNAPSIDGLISENKISGNPTITYGCGLATPTPSANIQVVSWNEMN